LILGFEESPTMRHLKVGAVVLAGLLVVACALGGTKRIADIRQFPGEYEDRTVSIEGRVTSSWSVPFVPMRMYQVDDGTGEIVVLAEGSRVPSRGAHVRVRGRLQEFGTFGDRTVGLHLKQESVRISRR
jgi:hypothetical protein